VDFSRTDIYESIRAKLHSLDGRIHVLVNNVGTTYFEYFASHPDGFHRQLININIVSLTEMCEIVLRIMTANINNNQQEQKKQKPLSKHSRANGVIINISSGVALIECPMMSTYGACKFEIQKKKEII